MTAQLKALKILLDYEGQSLAAAPSYPPSVPTRPLVRYHGGKWMLAPWIISQMPPHRYYVEPFGGGGSVLIRKPRSYAEVYNDLDGEIVNLFRVAREKGEQLLAAVELTPFARAEFHLSYEPTTDEVEQARRTLFRFAAGFSTTSANGNKWRTGFRNNVRRAGSTPAADWRKFPDCLAEIIARLQGVVIENGDALKLIARLDDPEALFYCDPPYVFESRSDRWAGNSYRHEMSDDDHRNLAGVLNAAKGMVIVSGYGSALYDELYAGWTRISKSTHADGQRDRMEVLWISPRTPATGLFAGNAELCRAKSEPPNMTEE